MELVSRDGYEIDIEPMIARANQQLRCFRIEFLPDVTILIGLAIGQKWTCAQLCTAHPQVLDWVKPNSSTIAKSVVERFFRAVAFQYFREHMIRSFALSAGAQPTRRKLKLRAIAGPSACSKAKRKNGCAYYWPDLPLFPLPGCPQGVLCCCSFEGV